MLLSGLAMLGCSNKPDRIYPPAIDAVQAGKDAIQQYDTNGDGLIGGDELNKAASIKAALAKIDQDNDKQVSAEEITARINAWKESKIGITSLACRVSIDGKPAEGATVTFIPEKFLGPAVKPAKGIVSPQGMAMLTVDDPALAAKRIQGAQCGLYRVEITSDKKSIPAKFNTDTTLGEEVAQDAAWAMRGTANFDLKTK